MKITVAHANGAAAPLGLSNTSVWGHQGRLAWLVDGRARNTTDTTRQTPGDYARILADTIAQQAGADDLSLQAIARRAIHDAPHLRADPQDPGAAASIALVRTGGEMTEWFVLGDCTVLLPPPAAGQEAIAKTDESMADVAGGLRARFFKARERAMAKAGTAGIAASPVMDATESPARGVPRAAHKAAQLLTKLEAAEAAARNQPGGPWIAAGHADAALEALSGRYKTAGPVCLAGAGAMAEPDDWFTWTARGADLESAAEILAQASGDDATILVA